MYSTYKLESIVSRMSRQPRNHTSIPSGCRRSLFSKVPRSPLGPRQPPKEWVPGALSPGVKCPVCVNLTTHLHPVLKLRISGATSPLPHVPLLFTCVHYQVKWPQKINKCVLKGLYCRTLFFIHIQRQLDTSFPEGLKSPNFSFLHK